MSYRKRGGSNRVVIYLSDENFLAVGAELTPPGESKPDFGAISKFFNGLVDDWRLRRALAKEQAQ